MKVSVSHDRADETPEAKALWFRKLSMAERMEMLCYYTDIALTFNPKIADRRDAQQTEKRILVLSRRDLIASKNASGRQVDIEDVRLLELPDESNNS